MKPTPQRRKHLTVTSTLTHHTFLTTLMCTRASPVSANVCHLLNLAFHNIADDNSTGGFYGYRMSKAALNMAATSLAHDLGKKSIAVGIVHPGMVHTDMTGRFCVPCRRTNVCQKYYR